MTPEEAIRIIKEECYVSNLLDIDKTIFINTALDMAVEALKAGPCEDCISREDVMDEINRIGLNAFRNYSCYSNLFDFIDKLSPVTPARKKGKWEVTQADTDAYNCNQCGIVVFGKGETSRFCPNCGAEMEWD